MTDRLIGYMVSSIIAEAMGDKNASTGGVQRRLMQSVQSLLKNFWLRSDNMLLADLNAP